MSQRLGQHPRQVPPVSRPSLAKRVSERLATVFTKNESQLNVVATPVEHLTCSTLQITEYPWEDFTDAEGSDGVSETEVDDD
ncbi:hypothetical protein B0A55_12025, partial [Friedmanniomyces simplex]